MQTLGQLAAERFIKSAGIGQALGNLAKRVGDRANGILGSGSATLAPHTTYGRYMRQQPALTAGNIGARAAGAAAAGTAGVLGIKGFQHAMNPLPPQALPAVRDYSTPSGNTHEYLGNLLASATPIRHFYDVYTGANQASGPFTGAAAAPLSPLQRRNAGGRAVPTPPWIRKADGSYGSVEGPLDLSQGIGRMARP
jgi:hypothetical protein